MGRRRSRCLERRAEHTCQFSGCIYSIYEQDLTAHQHRATAVTSDWLDLSLNRAILPACPKCRKPSDRRRRCFSDFDAC